MHNLVLRTCNEHNFLPKIIRKMKFDNRFDKAWPSMGLLSIAEASTLTLFGFCLLLHLCYLIYINIGYLPAYSQEFAFSKARLKITVCIFACDCSK